MYNIALRGPSEQNRVQVAVRRQNTLRLAAGNDPISAKMNTAVAKSQEALSKIRGVPIGRAVQVAVTKFGQAIKMSLRAFGLGAGETIPFNGSLPTEVTAGLATLGIDVSALRQIEGKWVMNVTLPEVNLDSFFGMAAVIAALKENLPVGLVAMPSIPRIDNAVKGIDAFRDSVAENKQVGVQKLNIFDDTRGRQTMEQLQALYAWAKQVQPQNVYNIVNGNLSYISQELAKRNGQFAALIRTFLADVTNFVLAPRDQMLNAMVGSVKEAYTRIQEAMDIQVSAMNEIGALYQGIQDTGAQIAGTTPGAAEDPQVILKKAVDANAALKTQMDAELARLQTVVGQIAKALGIAI